MAAHEARKHGVDNHLTTNGGICKTEIIQFKTYDMQATIDNLKCNANTLNNHFFSGDPSCLARGIECQLREILSHPSIPGHMINDLENTFSMVERSIDSSPHLNFVEKTQIRTLLSKAKRKIEIRLQNPYNRKISNYTTEKLLSLKYHGYTGDIIITSAGRSVNDQARIMYDNIAKNKNGIEAGKDEQKGIYIVHEVIDVVDPKLSREENIAKMAKKIQEVGPDKVSKHIADFSALNVIDIDKNTLSSVQNFKDAAKSAGFSKILDENGCIHIELPQPQ